MEFFTILLSGLLTLVSPSGLVIDTVAENAIRSRFEKVEQLQVRVDNTPNYQILEGQLERVRIAGRGLWLTPNIRIDALELETDPINVDLQRLRKRGQESPAASLREPLQAGVRLVLTEADINQALKSPKVAAQLQEIASRFSRNAAQRYQFVKPQVDLLENNRLRFQVEAVEGDSSAIAIAVESGLGIKSGSSLQLIEPTVSIDGKPLPSPFVQAFANGISNRFNLRSLEDAGLTARLLKLEINTETLEVATFLRFEPPK